MLVHAPVTSQVDYCNALFKSLHKLQPPLESFLNIFLLFYQMFCFQGKMKECCTTIQLYNWVSNHVNLNANGWSVPLSV